MAAVVKADTWALVEVVAVWDFLNLAVAGLAEGWDGALVAALGVAGQWVHLTKLIQVTDAVCA